MTSDELFFFDRMPDALPLYGAVAEKIRGEWPDVAVKVQKTQISFANKHNFAFVSLPIHRVKGWPEVCILVTFGLNHRADHPRIVEAVEPYPDRWTHHVLVQDIGEVDAQLFAWLREAYDFSQSKRRGRPSRR